MTSPKISLAAATAVALAGLASGQLGSQIGGPTIAGLRVVETELAGEPAAVYPFFQYVRAFNQGDAVNVAVDPTRFPSVSGRTADIYIVANKTRVQWASDLTLVDATGAPTAFSFPLTPTIQANTVLVDSGTLNGISGTTTPGIGYDVVVDLDRDGKLSNGDLIDGADDEPGCAIYPDITKNGPYTSVEIIYSGGAWLGQDTYYPSNISSLGKLPLLIVSHGNGHNYQWYDHIGEFMASWGWVVMSHQNNTGPGVFTASGTTLTNTDYLLSNLGTIQGGILQGHIDTQNICWIGHSRGGEGVTIAYDRIFDGTYTPINYSINDIQLISSIAPVDFLGFNQSNVHNVPVYHLWTGAADNDVNGCASCNICQTFHLHDRAEETRLSTTYYGVGHGDYHDGGGSSVASGPCLIGRNNTHLLMMGHLLPLTKHYIEGNWGIKDYLTRQWDDLKPIGAPTSGCVNVTSMHAEGPSQGKWVIDDFQTNTTTGQSSSGGAVTFTVSSLTERLLDDANTTFTASGSDTMNGMTLGGRTGSAQDPTKGIVFEYNGTNETLAFSLVDPSVGRYAVDFTLWDWLSFRACQATRHAFTKVTLSDTTFQVEIIDAFAKSSTIDVSAFGDGIDDPYQRTSCGTGGGGYHNEMETFRFRTTDFLTNGSGIDLTSIVAVVFKFGPAHGSNEGRIGLDEIELTHD